MVKKSSGKNNSKSSLVTKPISTPAANPTSSPTTEPHSFMSKVRDGIAVGIGANLGDRMMTSIFGPRTIQIENKPPIIDCKENNSENINCDLEEYKSFPQCIKTASR